MRVEPPGVLGGSGICVPCAVTLLAALLGRNQVAPVSFSQKRLLSSSEGRSTVGAKMAQPAEEGWGVKHGSYLWWSSKYS